MRPTGLTVSYVAAAVGAICASPTPSGAGALTINGSLASGGVATLDYQRTIGITSTANLSNRTFKITGTDQQGRVISETVTGPNNGTTNSVLNYLTVTSITISGSAAGALTVDTVTGPLGASQEIPVDLYLNPQSISATVEITGTINVTVQYTEDDVYANAPGPFTWFSYNGLTTITASAASPSGPAPIRAIRVLVNSGTGSAKIIVNQAGAVS
jgi:hypothetical protein